MLIHAHPAAQACQPLTWLQPAKRLTTAAGRSYHWLDEGTITAFVIPEGRGEAPTRPLAPVGPVISSNLDGNVSQARTYQDLLKDAYDEELFEYWGTSELVLVSVCPDLPHTLHEACWQHELPTKHILPCVFAWQPGMPVTTWHAHSR